MAAEFLASGFTYLGQIQKQALCGQSMVSKTKKEFVGRFWGHFNTVYKPFWGWNAMLQYIAHHINNEELKIYPNAKGKPGKHPALERASKWIQDRGNLVLIDFDSSDQDQMKAMGKFEQHLARTLIAWDGKFMGQLQDFRSKIKDRKSE
ncbi:MAG: hypothetical protein U0176_16695 [Bacteroidia bacterium]